DPSLAQVKMGGAFAKYTGTMGTDEVYSGITFQIGASEGETLTLNIGDKLAAIAGAVAEIVDDTTAAEATTGGTLGGISTQADAQGQITALDTVLADIGSVRSALGANINRLDHTINNLTSIVENTNTAKGRITDADFALETSNMTKQQVLMQAGMSILAQSNQMSGLVMSLLR